jgi:hypothetical protein
MSVFGCSLVPTPRWPTPNPPTCQPGEIRGVFGCISVPTPQPTCPPGERMVPGGGLRCDCLFGSRDWETQRCRETPVPEPTCPPGEVMRPGGGCDCLSGSRDWETQRCTEIAPPTPCEIKIPVPVPVQVPGSSCTVPVPTPGEEDCIRVPVPIRAPMAMHWRRLLVTQRQGTGCIPVMVPVPVPQCSRVPMMQQSFRVKPPCPVPEPFITHDGPIIGGWSPSFLDDGFDDDFNDFPEPVADGGLGWGGY